MLSVLSYSYCVSRSIKYSVHLLVTAMICHDYSASGIRKSIMQYSHILMCRDRLDGTLRGILPIDIDRKGDYTLLSAGLGLFKNYYRGSPYIKIIMAWLSVCELFRHPLTPIYVIGKLTSYKMYLKAVKMNEFYPVYNRETPEHFKKIFADYAAAFMALNKREGMKYNPETFVIEQDSYTLPDHLTILKQRDLQNPHLRFFVERNPGWKKVGKDRHAIMGYQGMCMVTSYNKSNDHYFR